MNVRFIGYIVSFSLFSIAPVCAHSEPQKWRCTAEKDGTKHDLTVLVDGDRIVGFDYLAFTKSEAGTNSCSVQPAKGKAPNISGNVTTFPLLDTDTAIVQKKGNGIDFDFSNAKLMNYCGQSATIAASLIIKKESHTCQSVVNQ